MRRKVVVYLKFTRATGHPHPHPHLQRAIRNYARLLTALGRSPPEVMAQINALCRPYGIQLGGGS